MNNPEGIRNAGIKQLLYHKAVLKGIPITTNFELSPMCNFNCKMCYIHQTEAQVRAHGRPMMRLEEWITLAEQMKAQGLLYILLTGGEPFLWPDFWTLYEKLYSMGFLISINSNGSLIDDEAIARLRLHPPLQINITLYGAGDETYYRLCGRRNVFDRVIRAVTGLKEAGILVRMNGSITPDNAGDLDEMLELADRIQVQLRTTTYMFPPVRKNPDMIGQNARFTPREAAEYRLRIDKKRLGDAYYEYLQKLQSGIADPIGLDESCVDTLDGSIRCMAGKGSCWVTWDGYLSLCGMIPDYQVDLRENTFDEAWITLKKMAEAIHLSGTCGKCSNINLCHSCAAVAYAETGTAQGIPTYLCEMIQAMQNIASGDMKRYEIQGIKSPNDQQTH